MAINILLKQTAAFTLLLLFQQITVADIIVTIGSTDLMAGGAGTLSVMITSDSNDELDLFDYDFQVTSLGSTLGDLTFSPSQSFSNTTPGYVFESNSGNFAAPSAFMDGQRIAGGDEATTTPVFPPFPSTPFNGYDGTVIDRPYLLTRFDLQHDNAFSINDQFSISLVSATFLTDVTSPIFPPGPPTGTPLAFTSNTGLVTVSSAAAVPEPSSLFLVVLGSLLIFCRKCTPATTLLSGFVPFRVAEDYGVST